MEDYESINTAKKIKDIFDSYYQTMVIFANNYLEDIDECKDVVQNAFLQLWESKSVFLNDTTLRAYLYKVVKNACFNKIKHYKVKEKYRLQNERIKELHYLPQRDVIADESARILHKAINLLSPRKKQIIELTLKGLSNTEIASQLAIALETVKSLKYKAYKTLRLKINKVQ